MISEELIELTLKIISGNPVTVLDEDTDMLWDCVTLELMQPRTQGLFQGSREIGSANLVSAYNLVVSKLVKQRSSEEPIEYFKNIIDILKERKLVRISPELIRTTFRVI